MGKSRLRISCKQPEGGQWNNLWEPLHVSYVIFVEGHFLNTYLASFLADDLFKLEPSLRQSPNGHDPRVVVRGMRSRCVPHRPKQQS